MGYTRTYYKCKSSYECHVWSGNKLVLHCLFYPARGYYEPRYHFENFNLLLPELNHEIVRFISFVNRVTACPTLDLDTYSDSDNFDSLF